MNLLWRALIMTALIEVPIVAICYSRQWLRLAIVALVANVVTNLSMNLLLPRVAAGNCVTIGESIAIFFEAAAYYCAASPRVVWRPVVTSIASNAASFVCGGTLALLIWR